MLSRNGIFAHRGLWANDEEKNTREALYRACEAGFSVETDVLQDSLGIRVSHDFFDQRPRLDLDEVLGICRFALNLKSDAAWMLDEFGQQRVHESGSFFFDGSTPVMFQIKQAGYKIANRMSDLEAPTALDADVLWVDSFLDDLWWLSDSRAIKTFSSYPMVVFVSPELHGRSPRKLWSQLAEVDKQMPSSTELGVCTDFPEQLSCELGLRG